MNHTTSVLNNLCSFVQCNCTDNLFVRKDWFTTYTWTINEEQQFQKWLTEYIINEEAYLELQKSFPKAVSSTKKEFVQKFTLFYGWDLSEMKVTQ